MSPFIRCTNGGSERGEISSGVFVFVCQLLLILDGMDDMNGGV